MLRVIGRINKCFSSFRLTRPSPAAVPMSAHESRLSCLSDEISQNLTALYIYYRYIIYL